MKYRRAGQALCIGLKIFMLSILKSHRRLKKTDKQSISYATPLSYLLQIAKENVFLGSWFALVGHSHIPQLGFTLARVETLLSLN